MTTRLNFPIFTASFGLVVSFGLVCQMGFTQDQPERSSVAVINASSTETVSMKRNGILSYPVFPQGAQIAGGPVEDVNWNLEATAIDDLNPVVLNYRGQNQESSVIVLIGDFAELELEESPESDVGFKKLEANKWLRAGFLTFPTAAKSEGIAQVIVCNGIPDEEPLKLAANAGEAEFLNYGSFQKVSHVADQPFNIKVAIGDFQKELNFYVDQFDDGLVVVLFRDAKSKKIKYVVGRPKTIESFERSVAVVDQEEPDDEAEFVGD